MLIIRNPLLDAFESVVRLGTTHAAAKELGITQTAVTQRIKALEQGLSATLFLRSRRGMAVTDEAKSLLQYCQGTRELEGQLISRINGLTRAETSLCIVGPTSAISTRISVNVEGLYKKHPFLRLHLQSNDHADLIDLVRRGDADLAVVRPEKVPNEMDSKMLKPDKYLLVAASTWKGRRLSDILENERVIDFYESDMTTTNYLRQFNLPQPLRTRLYVNENEALTRMFAAGIGFGTLTETIAAPLIRDGTLITMNKGQAMEDPLALTWYPRPGKMDYFEDIVRAIK